MSAENTPETYAEKEIIHTNQIQTISNNNNKERVTFRIPGQRIDEIEKLVETSNKYSNRSEAIRDAVNNFINKHKSPQENKPWNQWRFVPYSL